MERTLRYERSLFAGDSYDASARIAARPRGDEDGQERPRERLLAHGAQALSDRELLAVILRAGIRGKNVAVLAGEVADYLDRAQGIPDANELARLPGLGHAKACAVAAMAEYGRRRWGPCGARIVTPSDAYPLIRHYADRRQEHFICLSLNGANETLAVRVVTVGLINRTLIHPREIFADAIADRACAIVVAHNHPSGHLQPSAEDVEITRRLRDAGTLLGITLLDHLIVSQKGFLSLAEAGFLK